MTRRSVDRDELGFVGDSGRNVAGTRRVTPKEFEAALLALVPPEKRWAARTLTVEYSVLYDALAGGRGLFVESHIVDDESDGTKLSHGAEGMSTTFSVG